MYGIQGTTMKKTLSYQSSHDSVPFSFEKRPGAHSLQVDWKHGFNRLSNDRKQEQVDYLLYSVIELSWTTRPDSNKHQCTGSRIKHATYMQEDAWPVE